MTSDSLFSKWYAYGIVLMIVMIAIGGITRLTDSGLSMVDWEPVAGIIPPITNDDWEEEFNYYKQYPEYKEINLDMTLSEFKIIFFGNIYIEWWVELLDYSLLYLLFICFLKKESLKMILKLF